MYAVFSVVALSFRFCALPWVAAGLGLQEGSCRWGRHISRLTVVPPSQQSSVSRTPVFGAVSPGLGFLDLVEVFCTLRILEAWAELRTLLCDDARLESIAARGVAGPDGDDRGDAICGRR